MAYLKNSLSHFIDSNNNKLHELGNLRTLQCRKLIPYPGRAHSRAGLSVVHQFCAKNTKRKSEENPTSSLLNYCTTVESIKEVAVATL